MFSLTLQCKHLNHDPPNGLHGHCDEADDRVGESEVENQEVDIRATLHLVPVICFYITFDSYRSCYVFNVMRMVNDVYILKEIFFIFRRGTFVIVFPQ